MAVAEISIYKYCGGSEMAGGTGEVMTFLEEGFRCSKKKCQVAKKLEGMKDNANAGRRFGDE